MRSISLQEVQEAVNADTVLSKRAGGVRIIVLKFEKGNQIRASKLKKLISAFEESKSSAQFMLEGDGKSKFRSFNGDDRLKDELFTAVYNVKAPQIDRQFQLHEGVEVWPSVEGVAGVPMEEDGLSNATEDGLSILQERLREVTQSNQSLREELGDTKEKLYTVTQEKQLLKEELEETQEKLQSLEAELGVARERLRAMDTEDHQVEEREGLRVAWPTNLSNPHGC
jgi:hypothetical protein